MEWRTHRQEAFGMPLIALLNCTTRANRNQQASNSQHSEVNAKPASVPRLVLP